MFAHGRTYVCSDCKQHGLTSKNLVEYTCSRCDMKGGRRQFQTTDLQRDVARNTQKCLECKANTRGGQQCTITQCGKFVPDNKLSAGDKRARQRRKPFVCQACSLRSENAPTRTQATGDEEEYECSRCYHRGNRLQFQEKNWERDKMRGTQQCVACTDGTRGGLKCGVQKCKKFVCESALSASDRKHRAHR